MLSSKPGEHAFTQGFRVEFALGWYVLTAPVENCRLIKRAPWEPTSSWYGRPMQGRNMVAETPQGAHGAASPGSASEGDE